MIKRLLVCLLLGNKKEMFRIIQFKGKMYVINIRPYEPVDDYIERLEKALQKQGLNN